MGKLIDPVGSINKMYNEGTREVPYPVFMKCFDKLLKNPPKLDPAPPSEDLKEHFRAVCQAIDLGVADRQGRGKDRAREFREQIYPVWKSELPESEFGAYEAILDGSARKRMEERKHQKQKECAEAAEQASELEAQESSLENMHAEFAKLAELALQEEEAEDEEEAEGEVARAEAARREDETQGGEAPDQGEAPAAEGESSAPVPLLPNAEVLVKATLKGRIPIEYRDMQEKRPAARYHLGDHKISVRFVRTDKSYYLVLNAPVGFLDRPGAAEAIRDLMEKMEYRETQPLTFRKTPGDHAFKVKFGEASTYVACKRVDEFEPEFVAKAIRSLHGDLASIILNCEGGQDA